MKTMMIRVLGCLAIGLCSAPVFAATADGGFEFGHKPALDGAGWMLQPLSNVRASGNMAYLDGEAITGPAPLGTNPVGSGIDTGAGTFRYERGSAMGFIQGQGTGTAGDPPVPTPFLNQKNITLEGRFKISGGGNPDTSEHDFFAFETNALGSVHFNARYGRSSTNGTNTVSMSFPGGASVFSGTDIPLKLDGFVKMRIVTMDLGGGQGMVSSYVDLEDGMGWRNGPTQTYAPNTTRDRGSLVRVLSAAAVENVTKAEVDYIRWKLAKLETHEQLNAVPEPASLGLVGLGIAGFALARRRSC